MADGDPLAGPWRLTLAGLTRADVLGLHWADVDMDTGTVTVSRGRVALDHGDHVDAPKSPQRWRRVPVETIHPGTVALLRAYRARQSAERLAAGPAYRDTPYLVVDALGAPLRPEVYSDAFRRLCRAAGVPVIRLHAVRHSLAGWLLTEGVSPADGAALLDHSLPVFMATYSPHAGTSGITAAASALGAAGRRLGNGGR